MVRKIFTTVITILAIMITNNVQAESLFTLGATQSFSPTPKSLFASVGAANVGDLVSIVISETLNSTDTMAYNSSKSSSTTDNFTTFLKDWLPMFPNKHDANNYGGENKVSNSAGTSRVLSYGDTISAQVVQTLPNGNLVVQGKKSLVNNNERMDLIVSGVIDPRFINASGQIQSTQVANLQFAISGRGSVSRGQNEGIINRFIKYLF